MLASKCGIVLPYDIVHDMLIEFSDHDTLCNTRELQSKRVQRCTQFNDMTVASKAGNLENIKWIARRDKTWKRKSDEYLKGAVHGGHLECLKWLFHALDRSFEGAGWLYRHAGNSENMEICQWLLENGCSLNEKAFNGVVSAGNMKVMEWCTQNGCIFNDSTFFEATASGNQMVDSSKKIQVLEWLKDNDCQWGVLSLKDLRIVYGKSDVVVKWLQENGCPEYWTGW